MTKTAQTVEEYLLYLEEKGFHLAEDALGFISFGQQYTRAADEMVIFTIEWTLKVQKEFDGSFFVSLLENLTSNRISNQKQAIQYLKSSGMI